MLIRLAEGDVHWTLVLLVMVRATGRVVAGILAPGRTLAADILVEA